MSFERFVKEPMHRGSYDGLHLGKYQLTFTLSVYRRLKADRILVLYDSENKAIAIRPVTEGGFKMAWQVGMKRLSQHIPTGRYLFKEEAPEGYIFVHES